MTEIVGEFIIEGLTEIRVDIVAEVVIKNRIESRYKFDSDGWMSSSHA